MKKTLLAVCVLAITAFSFSSCEKCTTCTYSYDFLGTTITDDFGGEFCGKGSEVDDFESAAQTAAALVGATANCERN